MISVSRFGSSVIPASAYSTSQPTIARGADQHHDQVALGEAGLDVLEAVGARGRARRAALPFTRVAVDQRASTTR